MQLPDKPNRAMYFYVLLFIFWVQDDSNNGVETSFLVLQKVIILLVETQWNLISYSTVRIQYLELSGNNMSIREIETTLSYFQK